MKLILSQYLRSLKERAEFDRLLPDLLFAMNYVPISRPQVGVRQFGVDLATVGTNEEKGAGIGLRITMEMMQKMGADIWIESTKDIGTSVYLQLGKAS